MQQQKELNTFGNQDLVIKGVGYSGSDYFVNQVSVDNIENKEVSNAEKRGGVLAEFEIIGLHLIDSLANLGLELAVSYLKYAGKDTTSAPSLNEVKNEVLHTVGSTLASDAPAAVAAGWFRCVIFCRPCRYQVVAEIHSETYVHRVWRLSYCCSSSFLADYWLMVTLANVSKITCRFFSAGLFAYASILPPFFRSPHVMCFQLSEPSGFIT